MHGLSRFLVRKFTAFFHLRRKDSVYFRHVHIASCTSKIKRNISCIYNGRGHRTMLMIIHVAKLLNASDGLTAFSMIFEVQCKVRLREKLHCPSSFI